MDKDTGRYGFDIQDSGGRKKVERICDYCQESIFGMSVQIVLLSCAGFRPNRQCHNIVREVHEIIRSMLLRQKICTENLVQEY